MATSGFVSRLRVACMIARTLTSEAHDPAGSPSRILAKPILSNARSHQLDGHGQARVRFPPHVVPGLAWLFYMLLITWAKGSDASV